MNILSRYKCVNDLNSSIPCPIDEDSRANQQQFTSKLSLITRQYPHTVGWGLVCVVLVDPIKAFQIVWNQWVSPYLSTISRFTYTPETPNNLSRRVQCSATLWEFVFFQRRVTFCKHSPPKRQLNHDLYIKCSLATRLNWGETCSILTEVYYGIMFPSKF